ncbi:MAG: PAS domain-containing sensor histidine kinase [Anaerolineales bacterium]|nr:PAS domain-containing sensor histidine kinase [Anaerolineales bacterium]
MTGQTLNLRHTLARLALTPLRPWGWLAVLYGAGYTLALLLRLGSDAWWGWAGHALLVPPGLLAALGAFGVWQHPLPWLTAPSRARLRQSWALLGLALLFWITAHLLALVFQLSTGAPAPRPWLADLLRVSGYLSAAVALLALPLGQREPFSRLRLTLDMLITSCAVAGLGWLIFLRPITALLTDPLQVLWAVVYPAADLGLLLILLNLFLAWPANRSLPSFLFLTTGLVVFLLADLADTFQFLERVPSAAGVVGLGWLVGLTAFGLAALVEQRQRSQPATNADRYGRLRAAVKSLLPAAATFVLIWYVLLDVRATGRSDLPALAVGGGLALLLVARQGVIAGELELRRYAQLVNSSADPAFICDANGRLQLVNPALLAATGHAPETLLRQPAALLFASGRLPLPAGRAADAILAEGWTGEVDLVRRDGSAFPVQLALRPVHTDLPARLGLVGTAHDLTEQKRHEANLVAAYDEVAAARQALEALNAQLEVMVTEKTQSLASAYARLERQHAALQSLDQLKSEFVSLVSHELRAPLTNISGGIELLSSRPGSADPRTQRTLALVQSEITRLTQFVETILDLSALEAGRLPLYPAPLALPPVVQAVVAQFETRPGADRLAVRVPPDLPPVVADEQAITSVLFHLLDNAFKYAPAGEIAVEALAGGGLVQVRVVDQGLGIPPELQGKVFDKFERLNAADDREVYGHGLGLYMARRLLQAQGGDISAGNLDTGGAYFTFWLPAAEEDHGD